MRHIGLVGFGVQVLVFGLRVVAEFGVCPKVPKIWTRPGVLGVCQKYEYSMVLLMLLNLFRLYYTPTPHSNSSEVHPKPATLIQNLNPETKSSNLNPQKRLNPKPQNPKPSSGSFSIRMQRIQGSSVRGPGRKRWRGRSYR